MCMSTHVAPCSAATPAISGSKRKAATSFTTVAPDSSARLATSALVVSIEIWAPSGTSASITGITRRISSSAPTGRAPGRVDSPPMSRMSAPSAISSRPCAIAASASRKRPPSENESGVTLTMPMTSASTQACSPFSAVNVGLPARVLALSPIWGHHAQMRGLALCLVAGALVIAGCGSSDESAKAPKSEQAAASGGTVTTAAAVSAPGAATVAVLCTSEGKGKPKKQCTAGLTKLKKGKAKNPRSACKGMSKRKTKGVRGKSPYAVCVKAAARLMAAKARKGGAGNGAADSGSSTTDEDTSTGATDSSNGDDSGSSLVCTDSDGNAVPFDSDEVEE